MKDYYICIDVGGTDIKCGVVDEDYNILFKTKIKSSKAKEEKSLKSTFEELFEQLGTKTAYKPSGAKGVGVGFPGLVDLKNQKIKYMPNLNLNSYDEVMDNLKSLCSCEVKISNDAELAMLAEKKLGAGKDVKNFVMLTIGTGLGFGAMIDGKPLRSISSFSSELGHLKSIDSGDEYGSRVSTRALISQTKLAMQSDPQSKMWTKYTANSVSGHTVFEFKDMDKTAKQVFDNYIKKLGTIIANLWTLFSPELVVIGGGISAQGEKLTKPLEKYVNGIIFTKAIGEKVKIVTAKQTNDAGILGARCLFD